MAPRHISSSRVRSDKTPKAIHPCFGDKRSSGVTSDFVARRCVLETQDGSQITGSTHNFAGCHNVRSRCRFKNNTGVYDYETPKSPAIMADATSCRKSKMAAN